MKNFEQNVTRLQMLAESGVHWIKIGDDGIPEFYLDNQILQAFRACEGYFWNIHVEGWSGRERVWFLDLGTVVHKLIEIYYVNRKKPDFDIMVWGTTTVMRVWNSMNMEHYAANPQYNKKPHPAYKALGGVIGLSALLLAYVKLYHVENDRFRVIGAEMYFGKNKEVPLLLETDAEYDSLPPYVAFRLYLSGKIDLLIDDGDGIGPLDHKTAKDFRDSNPLNSYEVQEGMTGYVFAANSIIKRYFQHINRKAANKIWMNFLQIKEEKVQTDRFKRLPLFKTEIQLNEYRLRQIATATRIFQLLTSEKPTPVWNTMMCTNFMHSDCMFKAVHRQGSFDSQLITLNSAYVKKPLWNPETIDAEELARDMSMPDIIVAPNTILV